VKAGRELDALVAEKVMGWTGRMEVARRGRRDEWLVVFTGRPDGGIGDYACFYDRDGGKIYCCKPHNIHHAGRYSTGIAAAWEVVEKVWATLPKTGYGTFRALLHRRDPDGRWICEFAPDAHGDWSTHATAEADTAPLAICLAALRAVGVEVTP
jgi:hypothetical protein